MPDSPVNDDERERRWRELRSLVRDFIGDLPSDDVRSLRDILVYRARLQAPGLLEPPKKVQDLILETQDFLCDAAWGEDDAETTGKLLAEVADFLANEGYPWTANMLRDGSWRKRKAT